MKFLFLFALMLYQCHFAIMCSSFRPASPLHSRSTRYARLGGEMFPIKESDGGEMFPLKESECSELKDASLLPLSSKCSGDNSSVRRYDDVGNVAETKESR
jgi:hypothetical protein